MTLRGKGDDDDDNDDGVWNKSQQTKSQMIIWYFVHLDDDDDDDDDSRLAKLTSPCSFQPSHSMLLGCKTYLLPFQINTFRCIVKPIELHSA